MTHEDTLPDTGAPLSCSHPFLAGEAANGECARHYVCTACRERLTVAPGSTAAAVVSPGSRGNRRAARLTIQLAAWFWPDGPSNVMAGVTRNLSRLGCAIQSPRVPPAKTYGHLMVMLREEEDPLFVDVAAVRWAAGTAFGVEFLTLRERDRERLGTFLNTGGLDANPACD